jgi:hypothetical protein
MITFDRDAAGRAGAFSEPTGDIMEGLAEAARQIAEHPTPKRQLRAAVLVLCHEADKHGMSAEDIAAVCREVAEAFE